jgi:hypothetical protein
MSVDSSKWRDALVAKMASLFASDADRESARVILAALADDDLGERVAVACLKLAGANLTELKSYVDKARTDYRDVLAWAESPRLMQLGPSAPPADQAQARQDDAQEYARWLRGSS